MIGIGLLITQRATRSMSAVTLLGNEWNGMALDLMLNSYAMRTAPSATNTGKATDFISFSRASNATVVDSDGKVKWAPHNLLLASEQFDASSWTKTTTTVAANSVAAPNGTTTAETLTAGGANSTVLQSYTALNVAYTFGIWLRRKTGTGTIQIAADSGTWNTVTLTTEWTLFTVSQTPAAGTISAGVRIVTSDDEVYAWGAHLYRSDLGGMVANTSAYPMYNPTTAKNLLGYTESFDNAVWLKNAAAVTANVVIAPNGLLTADVLREDSTASRHAVSQILSTTTSGGTYVASIYMKSAGRQYANLNFVSNSAATGWVSVTADLLNGAITSNQSGAAGTYISSSITSVGDGWYRVSLIGKIGANTDGTLSLALSDVANPTSGNYAIYSYTGDGTSGVYLWGAQLSDSASLDAYVPNHFAAPSAAAYYGPRLDYDPSTLAAKGLLVEEQRTNLALRSEEFDSASWSKTGLLAFGSGSVANDPLVSAPSGEKTSDKIIEDTSTGRHDVASAGSTLTAAAYTFSVYARPAGRTWVRVRLDVAGSFKGAYFNISTGVVGTTYAGYTANMVAVGGGWYRCSVTTTATAASWFCGVFLASADGTASYAGDGTSGVNIWGAQLEAGSFATSYIPTTSASATRAADVAQVATSAFPYSDTEGTLVAAFDCIGLGSNSNTIVSLTDNAVSTSWVNLNLSAATISTLRRASSTNATAISVSTATTANTVRKVATGVSVSGTDATSVDGGTPSTQGGVSSSFANTKLNIGGFASNPGPLNGHIRQITYLPRRISNSELQARTA